MSPRLRLGLTIAAMVGAVVLLGVAVSMATTGEDDTSSALPDSVERLIPESGSEVLSQAEVGVDLDTGYDAWLIINGTEIRTEEQGLLRDPGTGIIRYQPGPGRDLESLAPQRNCAVAMVWKQQDGEESAQPVSWCFNVT
jgi:hypothetical protein